MVVHSRKEDKAGVLTSFAFSTTKILYSPGLGNPNMLNMFTQRRTFLFANMLGEYV